MQMHMEISTEQSEADNEKNYQKKNYKTGIIAALHVYSPVLLFGFDCDVVLSLSLARVPEYGALQIRLHS